MEDILFIGAGLTPRREFIKALSANTLIGICAHEPLLLSAMHTEEYRLRHVVEALEQLNSQSSVLFLAHLIEIEEAEKEMNREHEFMKQLLVLAREAVPDESPVLRERLNVPVVATRQTFRRYTPPLPKAHHQHSKHRKARNNL